MARAFNRVHLTGLVGGEVRTNRRSIRFDLIIEDSRIPVYAQRHGEEGAPPRGSFVLVEAELRPKPAPVLAARRIVITDDATAETIKRSRRGEAGLPALHDVFRVARGPRSTIARRTAAASKSSTR